MDTHGLPLSIQAEIGKERGVIISMPHFYRDALKAGWKSEKALLRIEEALVDVHMPREYIDNALEWLRKTGGEELPGG